MLWIQQVVKFSHPRMTKQFTSPVLANFTDRYSMRSKLKSSISCHNPKTKLLRCHSHRGHRGRRSFGQRRQLHMCSCITDQNTVSSLTATQLRILQLFEELSKWLCGSTLARHKSSQDPLVLLPCKLFIRSFSQHLVQQDNILILKAWLRLHKRVISQTTGHCIGNRGCHRVQFLFTKVILEKHRSIRKKKPGILHCEMSHMKLRWTEAWCRHGDSTQNAKNLMELLVHSKRIWAYTKAPNFEFQDLLVQNKFERMSSRTRIECKLSSRCKFVGIHNTDLQHSSIEKENAQIKTTQNKKACNSQLFFPGFALNRRPGFSRRFSSQTP